MATGYVNSTWFISLVLRDK